MKRLLVLLAIFWPALCSEQGGMGPGPGVKGYSASESVALVQNIQSSSCFGTSCSVTLPSAFTAGNLVVITANYRRLSTGPWSITTISAGAGTAVMCPTRSGVVGTATYDDCAYILSASAFSGPLVVTFGGTNDAIQVNVREYAVTGSGFAFDATADDYTAAATNPYNGPTFTRTGTNSLLVHWTGTDTVVTAAASPFDTNFKAGTEVVSYVGQCNGSTSCTPPAHQKNDLFVAYAGRDASTTAPTLPTGWTDVGTQSINGTSTADSVVRMACKIAAGSAETATGFTSANALVVHVYRGAKTTAGGTCASDALGTPSFFATAINTTSTTETFNSITNGASTSWDAGFGYAPAATAGMSTAPTGMTNRSASGTIMGGHDTNAAVASYSTANVTITTASRIITGVVEVKAGTSVGAASADRLNTSSNSAPSWTSSGTISARNSAMLAFSFNPTACANYALFDSSAGTSGNAPTATNLNSSTFGASGLINTTDGVTWDTTPNTTAMTYATAAYHALATSAPRLCVGGATYSDASTVGIRYSTTAGSGQYLVFNLPTKGDWPGQLSTPRATATVLWRSDMVAADTLNKDIFTIFGTGSGGVAFANIAFQTDGTTLRLCLEGSADACVNPTTNTWYELALQYEQSGTCRFRVYAVGGAQVGSEQTVACANGGASNVAIGDSLANATTSGRFMDFDKLKMCYQSTCTWPIRE